MSDIDNHRLAATMIRRYGHVMSDEHMKTICDCVEEPKLLAAAIHALGAPFNLAEVQMLSQILGGSPDGDGNTLEDEVLDRYADFVHNELYTYKPEAQQIDPSLDTETEHLGPMAQDIEKVHPAVVNTDPETGVKTVDTGRLSLLNAGAIAQLARKVEALENGR